MISKVSGDLGKLNRFAKAIGGGDHYVKVGIMGAKNTRHEAGARRKKGGHRTTSTIDAGLTNADLGAIHEFGSFSRRIPARSFLRMPLAHQTTQILKDASQGLLALLAEGKMTLALRRLGIAAENAIQLAFETRGFNLWPPDLLSTIARKRSNAPLIDTAQLRKSITSKVESAE